MSIVLHPFPSFLHPPFGSVLGQLPVTREGVRFVPELALAADVGFAEIRVKGKETATFSRGICGLVAASAFLDGTIRPHEKTLISRLKRQESLVLADGGALGKPVLLTVPSLKGWWGEADQTHERSREYLTFCGQNNDYELRTYSNPVIGDDGYRMANSPLDLAVPGPLVIADGHHRAETHARLAARGEERCGFVPVCIIGGDELTIEAFTRVIEDARSPAELLPALAPFFKYEVLNAPQAPSQPGEWLLACKGAFYRLTRKRDQAGGIDSKWLDEAVLPQAFGIADSRANQRISFEPTPSVKNGLLSFAQQGNEVYLCGFPLPMASFFAEVSAGKCLPPKSTRFEPRVPSGLVVWRP